MYYKFSISLLTYIFTSALVHAGVDSETPSSPDVSEKYVFLFAWFCGRIRW